MSHSWWLKFLLLEPDVPCDAFFCNVRGTGENLVQGTQKKKGVGGVRTEQTRAISSGTTTEAVTRPASGRVDISAVRLRAGSRLSVQRESCVCVICAVWRSGRSGGCRRCLVA